MDDSEFTLQAVNLLARCTTKQRADLVEMAQNFGKTNETPAMDQSLLRKGQTHLVYAAEFPHADRLKI